MSGKNPEIEFFSQLYDALTDEPRRIHDLRSSLKERGIDVDKTVDDVQQLVGDHRKRQRLQHARQRFDRIRDAVQEWTARGRESVGSVRDDLARALAGDGGDLAYQAYHRKLKKVSEDDLESLGEDAGLLEFIERIEADDTE